MHSVHESTIVDLIAYCVCNPGTAAAQQIEVVAVHMNNYIRQLDNSKNMLALQKKFTGSFIPDIIVPGRQFVKEGRLMKVSRVKLYFPIPHY